MLDIKQQQTVSFFFSPHFCVYSVIINPTRCLTASWTQSDTKEFVEKAKMETRKREEETRGCHKNSRKTSKNGESARLVWERRALACGCVRAFVPEARSQTLCATDNTTQRKLYEYDGMSCWAHTSKDTPQKSKAAKYKKTQEIETSDVGLLKKKKKVRWAGDFKTQCVRMCVVRQCVTIDNRATRMRWKKKPRVARQGEGCQRQGGLPALN